MEPYIKIEGNQQAAGATRIEPRMPGISGPCTTGTGGPDNPVARAEDALFSGEETDALRWYSRAMASSGSDVAAWTGHIRLQLIRGEGAEAQAWISRASVMFPSDPGLLALRAEHLAREGRIVQAIKAIDAIPAISDADAPEAAIQHSLSRAAILLLHGDRAAGAALQSAIARTPADDWRTPMWGGMLCDSLRQWRHSTECYRQALERRADLAYGWLRLAEAWRALGATGAARAALAKAAIHCGDNERLHARIVRTSPGGLVDRIRGILMRR